jgi:dihydropteroate synthase
VIRALTAAGVPVSVDTYRAEVAAAALAGGAVLVNDVSGGLGDPAMADVVREAGCPWILMHWRGPSATMQERARYADVVADVRTELCARVDAALAAGIDRSRLVIDPGLGFAKNAEHNWRLLAAIEQFVALELPVLVGSSRKSFLGRLLAAPDGQPRPLEQRGAADTAITTWCALRGVWGVRVHEVQAAVDAGRTVAALARAATPAGSEPP